MSIVPLPDGAGSPAEGNGSGIPMMIDAMRAHGLAEPLFCPGFDRFKVVLTVQRSSWSIMAGT